MKELNKVILKHVGDVSAELADMIAAEDARQESVVELVASENFPSDAVRAAMASSPIAKYAEGYPGKRYYGGCAFMDDIESLCQRAWRDVFNTDYAVNVQPHSGTNANYAVYAALLNPGDTILSPSMQAGGHLSHSSSVGQVCKIYDVWTYDVDDRGWLDYDRIWQIAKECRPKLIIAGASAYSRCINYKRFAEIAAAVGAYLMVDMAHVAGLIVAGLHPTPFGLADVVTTTTQKTLRGPRGGLIFCRPELEKKINSAVFPGLSGGPHMNTIAAKAVCAIEAQSDVFGKYIQNVVANAKVLSSTFLRLGYDVVTNGTDNHMVLLDLRGKFPEMTGKEAQDVLEAHGIAVNKNLVPGDERSPFKTSGLRIGTPAMTTKGWGIDQFVACAERIDRILTEAYERGSYN